MQTPLSIGKVTLTVRDLARVRAFYEKVVGLAVLASDGEAASLGAGGGVLLELRRDAAARQAGPGEAGLFHTAFLLPTRGDLARWVDHAARAEVALQGASDHLVSEALYLADPEGNGVEIYVDRPASAWTWRDGSVTMATERLDFGGLMPEAAGRAWSHAPEGTIVGHVHLQVGALKPAEAFLVEALGFDVTCRYPGATFYSTGGYHHHLATNIWNSRGAGARDLPATGLAAVELRAAPEAFARLARSRPDAIDGDTIRIGDPWGTQFVIGRPEIRG